MSSAFGLSGANHPRLLRAAWSQERAEDRHVAYATELVKAGLEFRPIDDRSRIDAERLVNDRVKFDTEFRMAEAAGGIRVVDGSETVAVMILEGVEWEGEGAAVRVTAVAVAPSHEGRGIGTVLLGMVPQVHPAKLIYGGCSVNGARLYQRAGFSVLAPGEALPFMFSGGLRILSSNRDYPCWFFRYL